MPSIPPPMFFWLNRPLCMDGLLWMGSINFHSTWWKQDAVEQNSVSSLAAVPPTFSGGCSFIKQENGNPYRPAPTWTLSAPPLHFILYDFPFQLRLSSTFTWFAFQAEEDFTGAKSCGPLLRELSFLMNKSTRRYTAKRYKTSLSFLTCRR